MTRQADRFSAWRGWPLLAALVVCAATCSYCAPLRAEDAGRQSIVVGGDRDYLPYEFLDDNGWPAGFDVDLSLAIGEAMGVRVDFVLLDWAQLHQALADDRVDVLQRTPYSNLWLREADLTPPHTTISHAIFARRGAPPVSSLEELSGKKVIVHPGGSLHDILAGLGFEKELIFSDTPTDGLLLPEEVTTALASRQQLVTAHCVLVAGYAVFLVSHVYLTTTGETLFSLIRGMVTGMHEHRVHEAPGRTVGGASGKTPS